MNEAQRELPRYKCHKEVWALKIKSVEPVKPTVAELKETLQSEESPNCVGAVLTFEEDGYAPMNVNLDYWRKHKPTAGGYYVVYKDGYKSFSPAEAFEDGYAKI